MIQRYQTTQQVPGRLTHLGRAGRLSRLACGALVILAGVGTYLWLNRPPSPSPAAASRSFMARGIIRELDTGHQTMTISHQAISNYMDSMTMPFKVKEVKEMLGLQVGDRISFRLSVTDTRSWIDQIVKLSGEVALDLPRPQQSTPSSAPPPSHHPLLDYPFTNELGQAVSLHSFTGQVLAITFFFTRCPLPDFCPRLSRNFAEASRKLEALTHGPTNWHFLSVSFDPEFDTPTVLKTYAEKYEYDPAHWSFLTGPKDKIGELARLSNVEVQPDNGLFSHNFRTMIIDASGRLRMVFPTGGDLSEAIVEEVLKAAEAGKAKPT